MLLILECLQGLRPSLLLNFKFCFTIVFACLQLEMGL